MNQNDPMTPTTLSPAAQAVLDAADSAFDQAGTTRQGIASALRAAADQLGYTIFDYENNEHPSVVKVKGLLAIAAELEGLL
jgi:hypothetical protein